MKRKKQQMRNPLTLNKLIEANKKIQDLKREINKKEDQYASLWLDEVQARRLWKQQQLHCGFFGSLVEYLQYIVLSKENMEDPQKIIKAKEEYFEFKKRQLEKLMEQINKTEEIKVKIKGKQVKRTVPCWTF